MRYRFVDQIVDLEPGDWIRTQYTWPTDLEIFEDHFPGFPVVPGVLLTEMMGQSAALCLDASDRVKGSAMLIRIKDSLFKHWVAPGHKLDIFADVVSLNPNMAKVKASCECDAKLMAQTELFMTFAPKSELGLSVIDPLLEAYQKGLKR